MTKNKQLTRREILDQIKHVSGRPEGYSRLLHLIHALEDGEPVDKEDAEAVLPGLRFLLEANLRAVSTSKIGLAFNLTGPSGAKRTAEQEELEFQTAVTIHMEILAGSDKKNVKNRIAAEHRVDVKTINRWMRNHPSAERWAIYLRSIEKRRNNFLSLF